MQINNPRPRVRGKRNRAISREERRMSTNEFESDFASAKYSAGQLNAMVKKLIKAAGEDAPMLLLGDKLEISVRKVLGGLSPNAPIAIGPLAKTFVPKDFFRDDNREVKLYIWDGFKTRVLPSTGKVSKQPAATIASYDLTKAMYDSEVRAELPENHVFAIDDLWMIADLISHQSKGESGKLLNNGYANLFYVQVGASVLVVGVDWYGSEWYVYAWVLGERGRWYGGCRVFSRNG
jgi:hypothetical protein